MQHVNRKTCLSISIVILLSVILSIGIKQYYANTVPSQETVTKTNEKEKISNQTDIYEELKNAVSKFSKNISMSIHQFSLVSMNVLNNVSKIPVVSDALNSENTEQKTDANQTTGTKQTTDVAQETNARQETDDGILADIKDVSIKDASHTEESFQESDALINMNLAIDATHSQDGYVYAKTYNFVDSKLMVESHGNTLYYNFTNDPYEVIPLQYGSGTYVFTLYENVTGSKYRTDGTVVLESILENENAAFLSPNQYVDYDDSLKNVTSHVPNGDDESEFRYIQEYITDNYSYDYAKAESCNGFILPDVEKCYENKKGICQDLAALTVSLLRELNIPSKLVIGRADGKYHAWTSTLVDGQEIIFDPTAAINGFSIASYIPERVY